MQHNRGGYTIIEVMIFLAISAMLFVGAVTALSGQQTKTEFSQSMRDVASKLKQWVSEVSNGYFPTDQGCQVLNPLLVASRPSLTGVTTPEQGANKDCVVLGKAIQFTGGSAAVNTFTVLGRRLDVAGEPVTTFTGSNPTGFDTLVDTYTLRWGATVKFAKNGTNNTDSYMAGFYNDPQPATSIDGALNYFAPQYPVGSLIQSDALKCIAGIAPYDTCSTPTPPEVTDWRICFENNHSSSQTALITVARSVSGFDTKIDFNPDPSTGC